MSESAIYRQLPGLDKRVHRLGLALNYGIDARAVEAAIERGVNYFFYSIRDHKLDAPLRAALKKDRERFVIAAIPTTGFFGFTLRWAVEKALRSLDTEYLDIFQLGWLGKASALTDGVQEQLLRLKESGKVRLLGTSIHDRPRAGELAKRSIFDMLMIRYNAAHPGAERDIFPHIAERDKDKPLSIVAYTATSWGGLLKKPDDWNDRVPTAGDCYNFCLASPHVDVVLTGPKTQDELAQNLAAVEKGPLSAEELAWMRAFGKHIHGRNKLPYSPR